MNEIGERIKARCDELRISITELAELSGINYKTLNNLINTNKPNPTLQNMKKLSITLGTSLDYLTFGEIKENEELQNLIIELKEIDITDKKRILYMIRMMIAESKNK